MQTRRAPLLPPRQIQCDDPSTDAYDVASSLSCDDNDNDDNNRGGGLIPTEDSDAITRGYNDCGKAVTGEITLAGAANIPVAEECVCQLVLRAGETVSNTRGYQTLLDMPPPPRSLITRD